MKALLLTLLLSSSIFSQSEFVEKIYEGKDSKSYKIDAHQFLVEQENEVTQFLQNNPDYFTKLKLNKKASWNFSVGDTKSWWATDLKESKYYRVPSTCQAVGTHCYIFVENSIWNSRVTLDNVSAIKKAFDNSTPSDSTKGIYETDVNVFGTPPDVDGDPKIIILILDIKDGYNGSGGYVAGYFSSVNELSRANSNQAEIYYMDANPADLSTEHGVKNVMSTAAHEFQHMIHFNYHDGTAGKPRQLTFLDEGCSMTAEVVCGYDMREQGSFNGEYNHYLFDWRSGEDEVLTDYSRAARYVVYLYNQFGTDILGKLVQSKKLSIASINDALNQLSTPTTLRFYDILENWFLANTIADVTVNSAWGYTTLNTPKVSAKNIFNPNQTSSVIKLEKLAADYITFSDGKNLSIKFDDFGTGKIKFKIIKYNINGNTEVEDVAANTQLTYSDFGTKYTSITFVAMNLSPSNKYDYSYVSTGESSIITIAYDKNPPVGVLPLSTRDTVCVVFDGVNGGSLDSITVALRQAGSVHGGIYEYTGNTRPTPLGNVLVPNLTVTSTISEKPSTPYPVPWSNWVTVDLTSYNLDASKSFVAAFVIEGSYPETNRIMVADQPDVDNHSFSYLNEPSSGDPNWFYVSSKNGVYAYLIRAYVNTAVGVDDKSIDILPSKFSLEQNYPNPFNPSTTISYSITESGFVTLKIYNMLGQEVVNLVNRNMGAGTHSVSFDASSLSSGTYLYKLSSGGNNTTKKMLLLK